MVDMVYYKYIGDPRLVTRCRNQGACGVCGDGQCPGYVRDMCSFNTRDRLNNNNPHLFMEFPNKKVADNTNVEIVEEDE